MPSRFIAPFHREFSDDGLQVGAGYKLYFYAAGTSTAKDTYADYAFTTPNANPVVADSDGRWAVIWLLGEYKVVLKDADDVQIWSADNVTGAGPGGAPAFETAQDLRDFGTPSGFIAAITLGVNSIGDEGGGTWYWASSSTEDDDTGMTLLPTGHVGAGRWHRDWDGRSVHAGWYGTVGDYTAPGVGTDDTDGLEASLAKAQEYGCEWGLGPGYYRATRPLSAEMCNFTIRGAGFSTCRIYGDHDGTVLALGSEAGNSRLELRGIGLCGNEADTISYADTTCGLSLRNITRLHIEDVLIQGIHGKGLDMLNCQDYEVEGLFLVRCGKYTSQFWTMPTEDANKQLQFAGASPGCYVDHDFTLVDPFGGSNSGRWISCTFEGNRYAGVITHRAKHMMSFRGCKFHGISEAAYSSSPWYEHEAVPFVDENSDFLTISDCQFDSLNQGFALYLSGAGHKWVTDNKFMAVRNTASAVSTREAWHVVVDMDPSVLYRSCKIDGNFFEEDYPEGDVTYTENGGDILVLANVPILGQNFHASNIRKLGWDGTGTRGEEKVVYDSGVSQSAIQRTWDLSRTPDLLHGTFTPVIEGESTAGTNTYSRQRGELFRHEDLVYIYGSVIMTALDAAAAGNLRIGTIPIITTNMDMEDIDAYGTPVTITSLTGVTLPGGSPIQVQGHITPNGNKIRIRVMDAAGTWQALQVTDLSSTTRIDFAAIYPANIERVTI